MPTAQFNAATANTNLLRAITSNDFDAGDYRRVLEAACQKSPSFRPDFENASFTGHKRLHEYHLKGARLENATLAATVMEGMDLRGTALKGANISQADLRGANVDRADMRGIRAVNPDLRKLKNANTVKGAIFALPEEIQETAEKAGFSYALDERTKDRHLILVDLGKDGLRIYNGYQRFGSAVEAAEYWNSKAAAADDSEWEHIQAHIMIPALTGLLQEAVRRNKNDSGAFPAAAKAAHDLKNKLRGAVKSESFDSKPPELAAA